MPDPISIPLVDFASCTFDPVQPRSLDRMEGRFTEGQTFGTPYWVASYTTGWLEQDQYGLMDAFMMQASDSGQAFLAYDPFRPRPVTYNKQFQPLSGTKAAGGVFNGDAVLSQIGSPTSITVSGLPAAFRLLPGDYVEIRKSPTLRSLHRIMAPATANASGVVTLTIRYPLDIGVFKLPCTAHFEKPSCLMQLDPGSVSAPKSWGDRGFNFTATEVFFS